MTVVFADYKPPGHRLAVSGYAIVTWIFNRLTFIIKLRNNPSVPVLRPYTDGYIGVNLSPSAVPETVTLPEINRGTLNPVTYTVTMAKMLLSEILGAIVYILLLHRCYIAR